MDDILTHPAFTVAALFLCSVLAGIMGFMLRGWYDEERRYRERSRGPASASSTRPATARDRDAAGRPVGRGGPRVVEASASGSPLFAPSPAPNARGARAAAPVPPAAGAYSDGWGDGRPLVLLVDDRLEILALHSTYLHQHGYSVLTAGDGDTALDYARAHHPAVMVLDHSMPYRTGIEVARELKRDAATRDIPILLMTAHSYGAVGMAAKEAGCDRFLSKPVEPSRMLREVEALVAPSSGRRHGHDGA